MEPEIPANTGNIARLCAGVGCPLHLIGTLGFRMNDKEFRRAGLDYWDSVKMSRHANFDAFLAEVGPPRLFFFSTRGRKNYMDEVYEPGDAFVFGSESTGLPDDLIARHSDKVLCIPMRAESVRSLNLANAVSVVVYEALGQWHRRGLFT